MPTLPVTPPTEQELIAHYKAGVGDHCLVCDEQLFGSWTDYNGQIRCWHCGTTYQILGCHLREEWMQKAGLTKEEVARRYCDCFQLVPLLRDYWQETHRKIPFGMYLGRNPIPEADHLAFYSWLKRNAEKYAEAFKDEFSWDAINTDDQL